jgi:hypothetical protein
MEQPSFESSQLYVKISLELAREKILPVPDLISINPRFEYLLAQKYISL